MSIAVLVMLKIHSKAVVENDAISQRIHTW